MRRRGLTREERELWRRAVRDVSPASKTQAPSQPSDEAAPASAVEKGLVVRRSSPQRADAPANAGHFVFGGGDPKLDRAAASRRIEIERTLDLHGMTQVEAHRTLARFMAAAVNDGVRLVLVVTGKGKPSATGARDGVLRSRFLDWIEDPALKQGISRVAPAKQKDGGAGAFYVFLKRKSAGRCALRS